MDLGTYDHIEFENKIDTKEVYTGKISFYNINTYKGRVFVFDDDRAVPFVLLEEAQTSTDIVRLMASMSKNAVRRNSNDSWISFTAMRVVSKTGRLKRYLITDVNEFTA